MGRATKNMATDGGRRTGRALLAALGIVTLATGCGAPQEREDGAVEPEAGFALDGGSTAAAVLADGKRLVLGAASGELQPLPGLDSFCRYEAPGCAGSCFAFDRRQLDTVMRDVDGRLWAAARTAVDQGGKELRSFVDATGSCQEGRISTDHSYLAQSYVPTTFTSPAPLSAVRRRHATISDLE
jgi:hypothetical protein